MKLKDNQDANLITEPSVLGINEANKIRELCRALYETPKTEKGGIESEESSWGRMESIGGNSRSE